MPSMTVNQVTYFYIIQAISGYSSCVLRQAYLGSETRYEDCHILYASGLSAARVYHGPRDLQPMPALRRGNPGSTGRLATA